MDNNENVQYKVADAKYVGETGSCLGSLKELKQPGDFAEAIKPELRIIVAKLKEEQVRGYHGDHIVLELRRRFVFISQFLWIFY